MSGLDGLALAGVAAFVVLYWLPALLPVRFGLPLAAVLTLITGIFMVTAMIDRPSQQAVDMAPFIWSLISAVAFSAAISSLVVQLVARRNGASGSVRFTFFFGAIALAFGLTRAYRVLS
ncbi:MAG TPA: hypothetical protein EYP31_05975 [Roseibacterium sp.]|nr:hypothetical protein [Roseibacterium sp.]